MENKITIQSGNYQKFKSIILCIALLLFVSSCCKCSQEIGNLNSILVENYPKNQIVNPSILYFDNAVQIDSIPLTIQQPSIYQDSLKNNLISTNNLKTDYEWHLVLNDSTQYVINHFVFNKSDGCCKGLYLHSYMIDGITIESEYLKVIK